MSTLRDIISDIRGRHKLLSHDNLITDRLIASEIRSTAILLIKRETTLRRLWDTDSIFTTLPCISMKKVPLAECGDYISDNHISRSKIQLPKIAESNYQYIIGGVFDIEGHNKIKYLPLSRYINFLKINTHINQNYFWIQNNYLYCSNEDIVSLRISALFEEDIPVSLMNGCNGDMNKCINPLDMEFKIPGYLESGIKDIVSSTLLKTYQRSKEDPQSDDKDESL